MNEVQIYKRTLRRFFEQLKARGAKLGDIREYLTGVQDTWDPDVYCDMSEEELWTDFQGYLEVR